MSSISAKFEFNGTQLNCICSEKWAQDLPIHATIDNGFSSRIEQVCVTNLGLVATFNYKLDIHENGSYTM